MAQIPNMNRRHYEWIAATIAKIEDPDAREAATHVFARELAGINRGFDVNHFHNRVMGARTGPGSE